MSILQDIHLLHPNQFLLLYRVEFDHLSELLRSRTVDLFAGNQNIITEPSTSQVATTYVSQENRTISPEVIGAGELGLFKGLSIPCIKLVYESRYTFFSLLSVSSTYCL